jgi:hypothetical protein
VTRVQYKLKHLQEMYEKTADQEGFKRSHPEFTVVDDDEPHKTEYTADKKAENESRYSERKLALIAHADAYDKRGWCPIKLKAKSKAPPKGWAEQHLTGETAARFFDTDDNIGVRLGDPSHGLVDLDLDWPEAVAPADVVFANLPAFGRPGKRRSHRLTTSPAIKTFKFKLPPSCKADPRIAGEHGVDICEFRSTGAQTVFPPSIHTSGEPITWDSGKIPDAVPTMDATTLKKYMVAVAVTALAMRCNPGHGDHYYAMIPFAGALLRIIPDVGIVERLVGIVCTTWGTKWPASQLQVATMKEKLDAGDVEVTGLPRLLKHLGLPADVAKHINSDWLGTADDDGRPRVILELFDLNGTIDKTIYALVAGDAPIYQRSGQIVHTYRRDDDKTEDGIKWPKGSLGIHVRRRN